MSGVCKNRDAADRCRANSEASGSDALTQVLGHRGGEILRLLGSGSRFDSITRGVIDLRDLYFLLLAFIGRFHYLGIGLSFVLVFIGLKMALFDVILDYHVPTEISLLVVLGLIIGSITLSLMKPAAPSEERK